MTKGIPLKKQALATGFKGAFWTRWGVVLVVSALALVIRIRNLGQPNEMVFDEIYYVKNALSMRFFGAEYAPINPDDASPAAAAIQAFSTEPAFVAHPPFGKWLVALGSFFASDEATSWRVAPVLIGVLVVALTALLAQSLTNSAVIGGVAGYLIAIDGLAIVMSRSALLDQMMIALVLLAILASLQFRWSANQSLRNSSFFWLATTFISFGLSIATKWSAIFFLPIVLVICLSAPRVGSNTKRRILFMFATITPLTYLATWVPWMYDKMVVNFYSGSAWLSNVPKLLREYPPSKEFLALLNYHEQMLGFHRTLEAIHPYESPAWQWPFLLRPTSFFYTETTENCEAQVCVNTILGIPNPLIWGVGWVCLVFLLGALLTTKSNALKANSSLVAAGVFLGFAPWLFVSQRPVFLFYAIAILPFLMLGVSVAIDVLIRATTLGANQNGRLRGVTMFALMAMLVTVTTISLYFEPIWLGFSIPYESWLERMWLSSWI